MNDFITDKIGKFWTNIDEFQGILTKNHNNYEFTILDKIFDNSEDYILVNGIIENYKLSFILINKPVESKFTFKEVRKTFRIKQLFVSKFFNNFDEIKFSNVHIKFSNIANVINFPILNEFFTRDEENSNLIISFKEIKPYCVNMGDFTLKLCLKNIQQ